MSRRRIAGFSVNYIARVTIAAVIGILFLKWFVNRFVPSPGARRTVNAV